MSETWEPVGVSWLGHRPEPFIHERLWCCPLTGRGPYSGAFDAEGRGVAYRQDEGYEERTTYTDGRIVVRNEGRELLATDLDDAGRPIRTRYASGESEHYRYDGDRLVEIDEAPGLCWTAIDASREDTGGRLQVEHDERGPRAIRQSVQLVWERREEPWPQLLAREAVEIAEGFAREIERAVERPGLAVAKLQITYVAQSGLFSTITLALEDVCDDEMLFWYGIGEAGGIEQIECDVPTELEASLLREAALSDPGQPQRTVLNAVASTLARRDWAGVIAPTPDFVAFISEHDEDIDPKRESLRAVNPSDRAAIWEARFPPQEFQL
jgi:YD repeat-containing protein